MADTPSVEELNQLTEAGNKAQNALSNVSQMFMQMTNSAQTGSNALKIFNTNLDSNISSLDKFTQSAKSGSDVLVNMTKHASLANAAILAMGASINKQTDIFQKFGSIDATGNIAMDFADLGSRINAMGSTVGDVIGKIPILGGVFNAMGATLKTPISAVSTFIGTLADMAGKQQKFESGFLEMAGAAGQLNMVFKDGQLDASRFESNLLNFSNLLTNLRSNTGISSKELASFATQLTKSIPGALQDVANVGGKPFNVLEGALKVAAGSGRDFTTILDDMTSAYENFGYTGTKALQFTAAISEVSNKLGIRLKDVQGVVKDLASTFRLLGDNTESITRVMAAFIPALREAGLSAKVSAELVQGMIKRVSDLDIGTKAFLSARSGGPGGLQGAFKIEKLIMEGKTDEVFKMLESTLKKQFGGRVLTVQDAASSPELASQFMRQRELIKSGAFGKLASTDQEANKLLEALSKGGGFTGKQLPDLKSGQNALIEQVNQGNDIQERNFTVLSQANAILDKIAISSDLTAFTLAKKTIGTGTDAGAKFFSELKTFNEQKNAFFGKTTNDYGTTQKKFEGEILNKDIPFALGGLGVTIKNTSDLVKGSIKELPKKPQTPLAKPSTKVINSNITNNISTPQEQIKIDSIPIEVTGTVKGVCINCGNAMHDEMDIKTTTGTSGVTIKK